MTHSLYKVSPSLYYIVDVYWIKWSGDVTASVGVGNHNCTKLSMPNDVIYDCSC